MSVVARQMVLIRDMKGAKEKHQDRVFAAIQGFAGNTSRKGGQAARPRARHGSDQNHKKRGWGLNSRCPPDAPKVRHSAGVFYGLLADTTLSNSIPLFRIFRSAVRGRSMGSFPSCSPLLSGSVFTDGVKGYGQRASGRLKDFSGGFVLCF